MLLLKYTATKECEFHRIHCNKSTNFIAKKCGIILRIQCALATSVRELSKRYKKHRFLCVAKKGSKLLIDRAKLLEICVTVVDLSVLAKSGYSV